MVDETKPYPLITNAIRHGHFLEVKELLRCFPEMKNLDVPGFGNWLIYSSAHGTIDIVEYLIDNGFSINRRDKRSEQSPLSTAASYGKFDIVDFLINRGASLDTDSAVINPIFASVIGKSLNVTARLLNAGIDTKVRYLFGGGIKIELDVVAFAMMQGEYDIAHAVALNNSGGDEAAAQTAMTEGLNLAKLVNADSDSE